MKFKKLTPFVTVGFIIGLLIYDAIAWYDGGQEATVSYMVITDWIYNYPAFVFFVGFVMGHLFWPLSKKARKPRDV